MRKLIIDGNEVYEVDEECMRRKCYEQNHKNRKNKSDKESNIELDNSFFDSNISHTDDK